jgi:drug/metabolite transporter (DMT)-like permease
MSVVFNLVLALGMLITGSLNTISTKAADNEVVTDSYGKSTNFNHPFVQAAGMFIGEASCIVVYFITTWWARRQAAAKGEVIKPAPKFNNFLLAIPATCDLLGTSAMYIGLGLTDASVFQMLRGSVVVFTAIFSVIFLKRKQYAYHWIGVSCVVVGAAIVGSQTFICPVEGSGSSSNSATNAIIGNSFVILAQIIVATQMVVEEKLIGANDLPALKVVGLEGIFGFTILSVLLVVMYFIPSPSFLCDSSSWTCGHFENTLDAFVEFGNNPMILAYTIGNIVSIAFFNFLGVSITKYMSASARMVLDSLRTMVIWVFSLAVGWESFCYIEPVGFFFLLAGALIYNGVLKIPCLYYPPSGAGVKSVESDEVDEEDPNTRLLSDSNDNKKERIIKFINNV